MVTMAQSAVNRRNTHTHVDRTHSLTHFTSTQLQKRIEPPCLKKKFKKTYLDGLEMLNG